MLNYSSKKVSPLLKKSKQYLCLGIKTRKTLNLYTDQLIEKTGLKKELSVKMHKAIQKKNK